MALQVWLPLNGNLNNQGLTNITVTNNGATVDNNGKIGKCYSFNSNKYLSVPNPITTSTTAFSIATWVYVTQFNNGFACICSGRSATGGAGIAFWLTPSYIRLDDGAMYQVNATIPTGTWVHVCATWSSSKKSIYLNGQELGSSTSISKLANLSANMQIGSDASTTTTYCLNGKLNDFRVYDRALAPKEIEILSRGLVCHYPLSDRSNQTPNNVAAYPTFDTSSGHGGWNHWGISGSSGSYGQTTDKNYIFKKDQTYAHWFSNASTATGYYLVYQSPSFSGGFRSLCAILKEENGNPITGSIVYPSWNANTSGGTTFEKWTSITPLGNGFYLCKCEGIKQDGSNNLIGLKVNAGYKVYVSECYIENDRTVCSDFFYPSTTVYDTSGYQYNGTVNGLSTVSSDTARYNVSTKFAQSPYIQTTLPIPNGDGKQYTFSWWGKYTNYSGHMMWGYANGNRLNLYMASGNFYWNTGDGSNNPFGVSAATYGDGSWHHFAISGDGTTTKLYIDGEFKANAKTYKGVIGTSLYFNGWDSSTSYNFNGSLSDFRLYATALSAAQVAELYNTAVSVANNGTLLGYELVEV